MLEIILKQNISLFAVSFNDKVLVGGGGVGVGVGAGGVGGEDACEDEVEE